MDSGRHKERDRVMERPLSVAVIGCGWAGRRHTQAFKQCGAIVRWAIDTDQGRAAALPGLPEDGHTATDYHVALVDPAVDAVTICLPHNLHAPVAVEAAQAGKHVLCEKPLAHSLEAADRMIAVAEQASVTLMACRVPR